MNVTWCRTGSTKHEGGDVGDHHRHDSDDRDHDRGDAPAAAAVEHGCDDALDQAPHAEQAVHAEPGEDSEQVGQELRILEVGRGVLGVRRIGDESSERRGGDADDHAPRDDGDYGSDGGDDAERRRTLRPGGSRLRRRRVVPRLLLRVSLPRVLRIGLSWLTLRRVALARLTLRRLAGVTRLVVRLRRNRWCRHQSSLSSKRRRRRRRGQRSSTRRAGWGSGGDDDRPHRRGAPALRAQCDDALDQRPDAERAAEPEPDFADDDQRSRRSEDGPGPDSGIQECAHADRPPGTIAGEPERDGREHERPDREHEKRLVRGGESCVWVAERRTGRVSRVDGRLIRSRIPTLIRHASMLRGARPVRSRAFPPASTLPRCAFLVEMRRFGRWDVEEVRISRA